MIAYIPVRNLSLRSKPPAAVQSAILVNLKKKLAYSNPLRLALELKEESRAILKGS